MAETVNISKMAELLSKEIFSVFGWQAKGLKNYSWPCVLPEQHHKKRIKKLHPTDVVFHYFDPYTNQTTYVIIDLKSYSKGSLQSVDLSSALRSLGHTVECAKLSKDWQDQYLDPSENAQVVGMLFIFNHDNQLDRDFMELLEVATPGKISIPKNQRVFVLSPERIVILNSIAKDILALRGSNDLPSAGECTLVFPDLVRHKSFDPRPKAATIEQLLAPWILLEYRWKTSGLKPAGKIVYWMDAASDVDDFKYLFDFLFRYQLVNDDSALRVRCLNPDPKAFAGFEVAKEQYAKDYWPLTGSSTRQSQKRMSTITFEAVTSVVECFSQQQVGFRDV